MAPYRLVRRNYGEKLMVGIIYQNLHFLKKGWFSYARVSSKRNEYQMYMAQLSLQSTL